MSKMKFIAKVLVVTAFILTVSLPVGYIKVTIENPFTGNLHTIQVLE